MTLYRDDLMEIYKNPANKGSVRDPTVEVYEKNPMCGDEVTLQLKVENGKIKDAKFDGPACSVSIISSDLLLESIIGKTIDEARKISKEELLEMVDLNLTTSRVKCATLVLEALKSALEIYEEPKK